MRPATGAFQMDVDARRPSHSISRGAPTFTDRTNPAIAESYPSRHALTLRSGQ